MTRPAHVPRAVAGAARWVMRLAPAAQQRMWSADAEETLMAVSYTHLRAHETVLDLVCRLLLAKINDLLNRYLSFTCT